MNERSSARIVADCLEALAPHERARFLRELIAHAAAGLVILEGGKAAAEACYRVSDAVVSRHA